MSLIKNHLGQFFFQTASRVFALQNPVGMPIPSLRLPPITKPGIFARYQLWFGTVLHYQPHIVEWHMWRTILKSSG